MKSFKIAGCVVGALALLAVVALFVALSPSVQTWAVRKAVAGLPDMTIEVERVQAGFATAQVTGLRVVREGMAITAASISTRHSVWAYLTSRRVDVDDIAVKDLVVDLQPPSPAATAPGSAAGTPPPTGKSARQAKAVPTKTAAAQPEPAKAAFEGVLTQARLPLDVRIARLAANGRARLTDQQQVVFDVKAADVQVGRRGRLDWTADFADSAAQAAIRTAHSAGTLHFNLTADRRVDAIELDATNAAQGPNLPSDQIKLAAKAAQPVANGDEDYSVALSLIRGGKTEQLLGATARFAAGPREFAGTWEIALRSEQLAALLAGFGLPEIAATGSGKFSLKPAANAAASSGTLRASLTQLQKLSPLLAAVGAVHVKAAFDGSVANNVASLNAFELELAESSGRPFAQMNVLQKVIYRLEDRRVTLADSKAEAARVTLRAVPLAWAQPAAKPMIVESGDLSLVLALEGEPDGSRVYVRAVEPLALRGVTVRDANKKALVENITLALRPTLNYGGDKLSAQLADLQLTTATGDSLAGTLQADVANLATKPATAFRAQLQAKLVTLVKPFLAFDPGPLAVAVTAEGRHEGNSLDVAKAGATVQRQGGTLLAALELLQPLRADLKAATFAVANPAATAARAQIGEVPLAWAEPYVAKSKLSGTFTGTTVEVTMRSVDDLSVTTTAPVVLRGVTAVLDGLTLAQALDVSTTLSATKRGDTIAYEVKRVDVKQGDTALAALAVAGEAKLGAKPTIVAKGNLDADLPALMKQPVLAPYANLNRGQVTVAFEASVAETTNVRAALAAKDLVAKQNNQPLGTVETTLGASLKADGSGTMSAPLTLTREGRKSDVSLLGTFGQSSDQKSLLFTGKIASANLFVDDFQAFSVLAPASSPAASGSPAPGATRPTAPPASRPGAPAPAKRDTQPFWKGANGKVEVDLKRIVYGKDYTITGVRGIAVVTDTRLSLDGLEGRFKENPFKLAGGITFAAQLPQPYALTASANVNNFDVGEFLRATSPNEKPALETKATLSAQLAGHGGTVGDLAKNAYGKFEVTGTQGMMNLLARKGTASAVTNIASLGLAVLGASRGSDTTMAVAELTRMLDRVPFDSVKLQIERAADLSFKLSSLEVLSPTLRLTGTGAVASKSTDDIQNAPMNIVLQLGAKSELAQVLQRVGQLVNKKDEKGYYLMSRTFAVGGTPAKPDNSALWKLLLETGVGAFLR